MAGWCLTATHGHRDLAALTAAGAIGPRAADMLRDARDVLLRLRAALQLAAKRPQDRLVFQYQELIPGLLGDVPDGAEDETTGAAIEAFMQDYFRSATAVRRYGRRVCERCLPPASGPRHQRRLDERFCIVDDALCHYGSDPFRDTPVLALAALSLAQSHRIPLSGETFDCIAEAIATPAAERLATEPEAQRRFIDLLVAPDDHGPTPALELCNELGLLERLVPELGPSHGRMQHDTYHVYTVDQHTLNVVGFLKSIARGRHCKDFPLATELHLELDDLRVLYLAALTHDLGKAFGGDHCIQGAAIARTVAGRAGLSASDVERCALLVREHVTLPLLSQKRDFGDPLVIESLAATVGDRRTLRELYLLSVADMAQVRPGNLTSWKRTLLDELYLLTSARLRGREPRARPAACAAGELEGMPERYFALYDIDTREHHAGLIRRMLGDQRAAVLDLSRGPATQRLTMVARDRPGLLAQMTALLDDHEMMVATADVFTRAGPTPLALDVFWLEPRGEAELDVASVTEMEHALGRHFDTKDVPSPMSQPTWIAERRIPTQVSFHTDPAGMRTIVEVETLDRPGVLRRITLAFAALGIEILLARCATEARRVSDVFYVRALADEAKTALADRLQRHLE
jgi:[protein-PII] uridylyltransferase